MPNQRSTADPSTTQQSHPSDGVVAAVTISNPVIIAAPSIEEASHAVVLPAFSAVQTQAPPTTGHESPAPPYSTLPPHPSTNPAKQTQSAASSVSSSILPSPQFTNASVSEAHDITAALGATAVTS